jgi:L-lactate utilization protein LutC
MKLIYKGFRMKNFAHIASDEAIGAAVQALEANGFTVTIAATATAAKDAVLTALPKGVRVYTATTETLETTGIAAAVNDSGEYDAIRPKIAARKGHERADQRRSVAAPDYVVGSVHALTQNGHAVIASATGSQLPAYAYGAEHVIWVVGAQKIVKDLREAFERLEHYVFPIKSERTTKTHGRKSGINKVLIIDREVDQGRIHIIIVKEPLGL